MKPCRRRKQSSRSRAELSRRNFLGGIAAGTLAGGVLGCSDQNALEAPSQQPDGKSNIRENIRIQSAIAAPVGEMVMPGPFPGRVVEVAHSGSVRDGRRDPAAVKAMIKHGMQQLVPDAESLVDAWRYFFQKGDRIGIKVVPVGMVPKPGADSNKAELCVDLKRPGPISSYEVVHEVIDGLTSAGIRTADIIVFDRYLDQFIQAGYTEILPEGIKWECCSSKVDHAQLEIDGQIRGDRRQKNVAGYDRDVFRELAFCQPPEYHDPKDDRRFRSHLTKIVTKKVDKVISVPVLKDHRSAGITFALKNMSHGLVNNVARSHMLLPGSPDALGTTMNHCQTFIPAAVSLPPTRQKCVLQILDGLVGAYEGGPGAWNRTFATWEYKSLLFATDPVALDRVGWEIVDAKRAQEGWPAVARMGLDGESRIKPEIIDDSGRPYPEQFHIRQPQHVPLAALLGLGVFDKDEIDHQRFEIA